MDKRIEYPSNGVILYGAGYQGQFAVDFVKNYGLQPIGFCDQDKNKVGTFYCGLPIWSKKEVKEKFGKDFLLWVTLLSPKKEEVIQQLKQEGFIDESNIYNLKLKPTLACNNLYSVAIVLENNIYNCCCLGDIHNQPPFIEINNGNWDETLSRFQNNRAEIIRALEEGRSCDCEGCPFLSKNYWGGKERLNKINVLAISPNYPCQLSCKYCTIPSNAKYISQNAEIVQHAKELNIIEMIRVLEKKNMLDLTEPIQLSAGEITILPNKKEILDYLSKYPLQIFSNCVVYDKSVSEIISRKDGSFLNVSIDAGTQKTYYEIKGMDVYEKVLNNIRRYAKEGAIIEIKYILLPDNCDKENLDGFLLFCREIAPRCINVSCDFVADHSKLPQNILEAAIYMGQKAKEYHISCNILPYFGEQNMIKINQALQEGGTI